MKQSSIGCRYKKVSPALNTSPLMRMLVMAMEQHDEKREFHLVWTFGMGAKGEELDDK